MLLPKFYILVYFCERASIQYKSFVNLCYHELDYGIKAQWHFLRQVMESHFVMELEEPQSNLWQEQAFQATENNQILNPNQMFQ